MPAKIEMVYKLQSLLCINIQKDYFVSKHYVMENGENQHTFIRHSEIAFPSERHSVVK